jgi:hypothetical protein
VRRCYKTSYIVSHLDTLNHRDPSPGSSELDLVYEINYEFYGEFVSRSYLYFFFASRSRMPLEPTQPPLLAHIRGYFHWAPHYIPDQDLLFTPPIHLQGMELKQKVNFAIAFT